MRFTKETFSGMQKDLFDNIDNTNELLTISGKETMLFLELKRDKHLNYKRPCENILLEMTGLVSIYAKHSGKYYLVAGQANVKDQFNNFIFSLSPFSPIKSKDQDKFYRTMSSMCPKGTTRNAIIVDTHHGIIPTHISYLYNRLYCIDEDKKSYSEAKNNLSINKKNNCMMFHTTTDAWLKDFCNHKYTTPGKKQKIGLALVNSSIISNNGIDLLSKIRPETIILFSESQTSIDTAKEKLINNGFDHMDETNISGFLISKMKWRELERP